MLAKYSKTALMVLKSKTNDGILGFLPNIALKIIHTVPLMFLWTVLVNSGAEVSMSLEQLLSYTYINMIFGNILTVQTMLSEWNYSGELSSLFSRPYSLLGQVFSHTLGGWLFNLMFFAPIMLIIAPFIGVNIIPQSPLFLISLLLCISIGFAVDLIFACVAVQFRGVTWLIYSIRIALISILSGAVIPFELMPFGLDNLLKYQPFGSMNGAVLSIFVGIANVSEVIITQIFWNIALWIFAVIIFKKSREKMVSYGG